MVDQEYGMKTRRTLSRTTVFLLWDVLLLAGLLVSWAPALTGLAWHEWLGLAFGAALLIHTLLHWQWIAAVTRRFFARVSWASRLNYLLGAALFVSFTLIIFSGVMESRVVLAAFGLRLSNTEFWRGLHHTAADLTLWLAALHIAVHWNWIVNGCKRLLKTPACASVNTSPAAPAPVRISTHE